MIYRRGFAPAALFVLAVLVTTLPAAGQRRSRGGRSRGGHASRNHTPNHSHNRARTSSPSRNVPRNSGPTAPARQGTRINHGHAAYPHHHTGLRGAETPHHRHPGLIRHGAAHHHGVVIRFPHLAAPAVTSAAAAAAPATVIIPPANPTLNAPAYRVLGIAANGLVSIDYHGQPMPLNLTGVWAAREHQPQLVQQLHWLLNDELVNVVWQSSGTASQTAHPRPASVYRTRDKLFVNDYLIKQGFTAPREF